MNYVIIWFIIHVASGMNKNLCMKCYNVSINEKTCCRNGEAKKKKIGSKQTVQTKVSIVLDMLGVNWQCKA